MVLQEHAIIAWHERETIRWFSMKHRRVISEPILLDISELCLLEVDLVQCLLSSLMREFANCLDCKWLASEPISITVAVNFILEIYIMPPMTLWYSTGQLIGNVHL